MALADAERCSLSRAMKASSLTSSLAQRAFLALIYPFQLLVSEKTSRTSIEPML